MTAFLITVLFGVVCWALGSLPEEEVTGPLWKEHP